CDTKVLADRLDDRPKMLIPLAIFKAELAWLDLPDAANVRIKNRLFAAAVRCLGRSCNQSPGVGCRHRNADRPDLLNLKSWKHRRQAAGGHKLRRLAHRCQEFLKRLARISHLKLLCFRTT